MPRTWPLAGRDEELRAAARALGPRDDRCGVVLSGPAGVGKTRLAREVVARLGKARPVHWALATEAAREIPLAAFGGLLEGLGPPGPAMLDRAVAQLAGDGRGRPPVLGVDDAHLLDDFSAVLVHRLVARRLGTTVLTTRDGAPTSGAITALWKDEHLTRVAVSPLSADAVRELLERVLDGPVETYAARRLVDLTRGNPLFLRLLVDGELAAGRLRRRDGVWSWGGAPRISGELADIVRCQMGDLPRGVRDTVDVLAVAEPLGVETMDSLVGCAALETAEQRGLAEAGREGDRLRVRLTHPMYGEVRRVDMGEVQARRVRGLVATALVATGDAEEDVVRRAVLLLDSDRPPDPPLFLAAGRHALAHFELDLGERLARAAAATGGDFEARLTHAFALIWQARGEEAAPLLNRLVADAADEEEVVRASVPRAGNLFWVLQRPGEAQDVLEEALRITAPGPAQDPVRGILVAVDAALGRFDAALRTGPGLLTRGTLTETSAVMAAAGVAQCAGTRGRMDLAEQAARAGYAAAAAFTTVGPEIVLGDAHVLALRLAGRIDEAGRVAERLRRASGDVAGPGRPMSLLVVGHAAVAAGRVRTAERCVREARSSLGSDSPHPLQGWWLTLLAEALAMAGRAAEGRRVFADLSTVEDVVYGAVTAPERHLARGWLAAAEGSTSEAIAATHDAADLARETGAAAYEVLALQTATQYGDPSGAARLEELAGSVDGPRALIALAHARATAHRDGAALMQVSQRWEEVGDLTAAVDAAAQAAVHLRSDDRNGSALTAAHRAHALAAGPCEGLVTPALRAAARPLPLTGREREIAMLAATGCSNKEIAERLTVSVRTVEGHLYRAANKLGIHERSALVDVLAIDEASQIL